MKMNIYYLLTLLSIISCSELKNDEYKLNGTDDKNTTGTLLLINEEDEIFEIDINNRKFEFSGIAKHTECITLVWKDSYKNPPYYAFKFFVSPHSNNNIIINRDSIDFSYAKGNETQEKYNTLNRNLEKIKSEWLEEYNKVADNDSLIKDIGEYFNKRIAQLETKFIEENPSCFVSPFLLYNKLGGISNSELVTLFNYLDKNLAKSKYYQGVADKIKSNKLARIGEKMKDFELKDTTGTLQSFQKLSLNKTVLIDVWFSGCAPCRKANKELRKLHQEFHGFDFEIISVSIDENEKSWKNAIEKDKMTWVNLIDSKRESDIIKYYHSESYPTTYLLNNKGIIQAINPPFEVIRNYLLENISDAIN